MKRFFAMILVLVLCLSLAACGAGSAEGNLPGTPENWDRIAQATATMNTYYNCTTIEEMKQVMARNTPQSALEEWYDYYTEYITAGDPAVTKVQRIHFVETHKGVDVFAVTANTLPEGEEFPEEMPQIGDSADGHVSPMHSVMVHTVQFVGLVIEDGRYVVNVKSNRHLMSRYEACMVCNLGITVQQGDIPCVTCDGTGQAPKCTTCGGMGVLSEAGEHEEDAQTTDDQLAFSDSILIIGTSRKDCPDCISGYEEYFQQIEAGVESPVIPVFSVDGLGIFCPDCGGCGFTGSKYIACTECEGVGYKIH